jgi:DNA-binding NarL/FixJ family response regulator
MIRVLLVDDHPVVRAGPRGMLAAEPDIEVAGEAGSGPEAVAAARAGDYQVVLMDLRMPGGDGVTATRQIAVGDRAARVLVLTTSARETEVLARVARGATNAEIGRELFISEATVKTHLLRAFGKLGVSDRTAAVTTAIERGVLPPPGS